MTSSHKYGNNFFISIAKSHHTDPKHELIHINEIETYFQVVCVPFFLKLYYKNFLN
jgi:hypothetical protein